MKSLESVKAAKGDIPLNFFQYLALAMMKIFNDENIDLWIVEIGIGGRLDPTNILNADLSIITNVQLDHEEILGKGIENIAKEIEEESKDSSIQKSICSLMIEVAYADNQLDDSELKVMANSLSKLDIEKEEIQEIVDATLAKSKESISFYEHTRILNDQLDYDQKKEVLNSVWAIAFADGEMDKHEEHLIRRIADLLYLNHKDFINAKLNQKETNEDS